MREIVVLLVLCAPLVGCCTTKPQEDNPPLVIGERIWKLTPGETITVPEVREPAVTMYMVDNVGLSQWLQIYSIPTTNTLQETL